ncbi:Vesicle-trafficking protein SEC22b [Echinococcus granulosus]|nr:Vesicle-trafficking protein SEC22b [Echinococcus granulosus]CDS20317.1 vesicle trafficking protein SEC22b [Echinococcus granulosus]
MILFTLISRVADGLPLVASVKEDTELSRNLVSYQNQAKMLIRRLVPSSPTRCSLVAGTYYFHYLFESGICYLILTEVNFPRQKAFAFLEEVHNQFSGQYSNDVYTVSRPYGFIEFDRELQKLQQKYTDTRVSSNVSQLNVALQDVQRIMIQNIDDVLKRGEALTALDVQATHLSDLSRNYRNNAASLNLQSSIAKYLIIFTVAIILLSFLYFRFLW